MGGVLETVTAGVSAPLSESSSVFADVSLILKGLGVNNKDWLDKPVVVTVGVQRAF